jgi:small subunit ribosomal protein S21
VPKVVLKPNESVDRALRRLKKKMDKEGIIKQLKKHRHYEKPSDKRRRIKKRSRSGSTLFKP